MPFITQEKTNLKYILIIVVLAAIVAGGILVCQHWWEQKEEMPPQTINIDKNDLYSCTTDDDCFSSCGCGCMNKKKFCPGDERECDGYPCQCSNNKCIKKDETADWQNYKIVTDESGKIVVAKINYPTEFKGVLTELHIENDQMSVLSKPEIANGGYPNYFPGSYKFMARVVSFNNDILGEYGFGDPRIKLGEQGYQGPTWLDSTDFTLIIPYFEDARKINIYSSTRLILSIDISDLVKK